jgi:predicted enzyme related to lactoylglutathione lyase
MITKARSVGIYVTDQQRALDFYTQKLGFQLLQDQPMGPEMSAARWIVVAPPGAETPFVLFTPPGSESRIGGFHNVVFDTDDIQATYETLRTKGVEFSEAPAQMPWGWWAQFKDPDGNEFGIGQSGE